MIFVGSYMKWTAFLCTPMMAGKQYGQNKFLRRSKVVRQYGILRFQVVFCKIMITYRIRRKEAQNRFCQDAALKRQHNSAMIFDNQGNKKVWKYNGK